MSCQIGLQFQCAGAGESLGLPCPSTAEGVAAPNVQNMPGGLHMVPKWQANLLNIFHGHNPLQNSHWKIIVSVWWRSAAHSKFEFIQSSHVMAGTWRRNHVGKVQVLYMGYSLFSSYWCLLLFQWPPENPKWSKGLFFHHVAAIFLAVVEQFLCE